MMKYLHVMIVKTCFAPFIHINIHEYTYNLRKNVEIMKLQAKKNMDEEFNCIYIFL